MDSIMLVILTLVVVAIAAIVIYGYEWMKSHTGRVDTCESNIAALQSDLVALARRTPPSIGWKMERFAATGAWPSGEIPTGHGFELRQIEEINQWLEAAGVSAPFEECGYRAQWGGFHDEQNSPDVVGSWRAKRIAADGSEESENSLYREAKMYALDDALGKEKSQALLMATMACLRAKEKLRKFMRGEQ